MENINIEAAQFHKGLQFLFFFPFFSHIFLGKAIP